MTNIARPTAIVATLSALAAGVCLVAPSSRASTYGDAAWCVISSGGDETRRNCAYRTAQDCLQALASSGRGSCDVNPYGASAAPGDNAPARGRRR